MFKKQIQSTSLVFDQLGVMNVCARAWCKIISGRCTKLCCSDALGSDAVECLAVGRTHIIADMTSFQHLLQQLSKSEYCNGCWKDLSFVQNTNSAGCTELYRSTCVTWSASKDHQEVIAAGDCPTCRWQQTWAVSGSIGVLFLFRQKWKLDWIKPWRKASTGNPGSLAGPPSHRRWELTRKALRWHGWWTDPQDPVWELLVCHTHFRSHLSDPAEPAGGPRAPPGRPSRLFQVQKKITVACWVVQHAVSREIALRRSLDLRGLFSRLPARAAWPTLPTSPHGACQQLCCKSCNRSTTRPQQRSSSMGKCESRNACSSGTTPPEVWHHKHHSALLRATEAMQHKKYTHHWRRLLHVPKTNSIY